MLAILCVVAVGFLLGAICVLYLKSSINTRNQEELDTQLMSAVKIGDEQTALRLLRRGANPNKRDFVGSSLHHAVLRGHWKLISQLVMYGADVEQGLVYQNKPLHLLVYSPKKVECLNELIKNNVDMNSRDFIGNTLLQKMVKRNANNVLFIERLILLGMDVNTVDLFGDNCIHYLACTDLCVNDNAKILTELFIKQGININYQNFRTLETPLHLACRRGKSYLVEILLRAGATLDAIDMNGRTALDSAWASERSAIRVSRLVIKHLVLRIHREEAVNQTLIEKIKSNMEMRILHDEFVEDLNNLKTEISRSYRFSYHDILCGRHQIVVKYMRNIRIRIKVFRCSNVSTNYMKEIKRRVKELTELMKKQKKRYEVVDKICQKRLPHLCVEKISSYLSLEDLQGCSFILDEKH